MRIIKYVSLVIPAVALAACVTHGVEAERLRAALTSEPWLVEDIAGRGVIDYAQTTLQFDADGHLTGNTACNEYSATHDVGGTELHIADAKLTKRACPAAVMDQEERFLGILSDVSSFSIDDSGALILSTPSGTTMLARRTSTLQIIYHCADGSVLRASYPTPDIARVVYDGRTFDMAIAVSASGARYIGGGFEWWTKGLTYGMLTPQPGSEDVASNKGQVCATA